MNWRKWSNDRQMYWVFNMTLGVMVLGMIVGIVLQLILG